MRFANPHPPRRGAFLLIALFSCLQILFGFFLFTGNGQDSALPVRSSIQIASYDDPALFNKVEPASGYEPQITSLKHDCNQCGTFSYFDKYRRKTKDGVAARQKYMQQKRMLNSSAADNSKQDRYNPVNHRVISNITNYPAPSSNYDK
jgi:hypothetical protein